MGKNTLKHKNPDNPFAGLKIQSSEQKASETPRQIKRKKTKSEADDDAELFLSGIGDVRPLGEKTKENRNRPLPNQCETLLILTESTDGAASCTRGKEQATGKKNESQPGLRNQPEHAVWQAETLLKNALGHALAAASLNHDGKTNVENNLPHKKTDVKTAASLPVQTSSGADTDLADARAFLHANADVAPLAGKERVALPEPEPQPASFDPGEASLMRDFMDGRHEFALNATDEYVEAHVVGLDYETIAKLHNGQFSPQAHIDLHGLNSAQAYINLTAFFRNAYNRGHRTVLIVTGRGNNSPAGIPVLKNKVCEWLTKEPFRRAVLAFCTAKQEDGGAGAMYVLIRKRRKKEGKIYWDRTPEDPDLFPV
ncbi:MAG: Smr/MutS family protein [Mailhella sp.]|nr:Smr/MutS family protein [Mailhella sp.]